MKWFLVISVVSILVAAIILFIVRGWISFLKKLDLRVEWANRIWTMAFVLNVMAAMLLPKIYHWTVSDTGEGFAIASQAMLACLWPAFLAFATVCVFLLQVSYRSFEGNELWVVRPTSLKNTIMSCAISVTGALFIADVIRLLRL